MDISTLTVSLLRQRMFEDMRRRKFEPKTQSSYLRAVRNLAAFLKASPDIASAEDLRRFQMHMVEQGTSPITLNATISGLKFFFDVTLGRGELMAKMQPVRVPLTLPVVLSRLEVARLLAATRRCHTSLNCRRRSAAARRVQPVARRAVRRTATRCLATRLPVRQLREGPQSLGPAAGTTLGVVPPAGCLVTAAVKQIDHGARMFALKWCAT
jgi:integrase